MATSVSIQKHYNMFGPGSSGHSYSSSMGPASMSAMGSSSAGASTLSFTSASGSTMGHGSGMMTPTGPGGSQLQPGAPLAANSLGNKPAIAGSSLYQACLQLRDRLWCVPGFGETFLEAANGSEEMSSQASGSNHNLSSLDTRPKFSSSDPVTQLWQCFRLGAPLCWLFNCLNPEVPLALSQDATRSNANECKKQVAKFIMALQHTLGWDPDDIFTVSQLYLNDTNGFVKVVRTVSKLLDVFESRGLLAQAPQSAIGDELEKPTDDRTWIVRELLNTERKYVQDLEVLQSYARALAQYDIIPTDTIHSLFGNLNTLVDVQRRFLICIEENVRRPVDEQHFGHVFRTMEADFAVYEPFCANYAQALDIINAEAANLVRLQSISAAQSYYLEPSYELPTFLIKPVQRICKYPLLLDSLLKKTPEDARYYPELADGLNCIRRITDKVNETRRLQENIQIVRDLQARVEDWKGHNVATFGNLLLSDVFMVSKSDTEREYHVYLFEKILLCCKEVVPHTSKKNSKSNSLLKAKPSTAPTPPGKKPKSVLQLKGRIFINNVTSAIANSKVGSVLGAAGVGPYALHVWWRGDLDQESFSLRCKNDEQLKLWQGTITRLIEEVTIRKQQLAAQYGHTSGVSPGTALNMNSLYAAASGRRSGSVLQTTPHSLFPQTPVHDISPGFNFSRTQSQGSAHQMEDEALSPYGAQASASGRGTPLGGRYSQPAEQRDRGSAQAQNDGRPRARTEDQDGSTLTQWRSNSPGVMPPLPRNGSTSGYGENGTPTLNQLRKASSSKQLRQNSASNTHAFPRPPHRSSDAHGDMDGAVEQLDGMSMSGGAASRAEAAQAQRMRSTSTPTAAGAAMQQQQLEPVPPMPRHHQQRHGHRVSPSADGVMGSMALPNGKTQRFSSSSISTVDSKRSSRSRPGSTAASSPVTHSAGSSVGAPPFTAGSAKSAGGYSGRSMNGHASNGSTHQSATMGPPSNVPTMGAPLGKQMSPTAAQHSNAVKLVIHYGDDKLVVVVLATVTLQELNEKVSRKIRLISGRKIDNLKIRYIDEDGDRVLMHDDDDVQMAFETSRSLGTDVDLVVS